MPSSQCLVVCQLCSIPPYKSWSYAKMVDHLKCSHKIHEYEDAERLATDWLTDARRGRPRYPRSIFENTSAEELAEKLGFILTSPDRELYGITVTNDTGAVKRKSIEEEELSDGPIVDTTYSIEVIRDSDMQTTITQSFMPHIDNVSSAALIKEENHSSTGTASNEVLSLAEMTIPWAWVDCEATHNAAHKMGVLFNQSNKKKHPRVYWYLCPRCGIASYHMRCSKKQSCDHCKSSDHQKFIRAGWRPIAPSLWAWIRSLFRNNSNVLAEVTGILRDFGALAVTEDGLARLGEEVPPPALLKERKYFRPMKSCPQPPRSFDDLFPLYMIDQGQQRAYHICPYCSKIFKKMRAHFLTCKAMPESNSETVDTIYSLLTERRSVIPSSKLRKLMSLTKERKDLRLAVAAVLGSVGSTVLDDTVISPWEFVSRA